jgi:F0F1-type ATP synthase assembly protein I
MQCPNCKFYKVDSEARESVTPTGSYSDPKIAEAFGTVIFTVITWVVGLIVAVIIGAIVGAIFGNPSAGESLFAVIWTLGCLIVGILIVARLLNNKGTHYDSKHLGYSHHCRHCGYDWRT